MKSKMELVNASISANVFNAEKKREEKRKLKFYSRIIYFILFGILSGIFFFWFNQNLSGINIFSF